MKLFYMRILSFLLVLTAILTLALGCTPQNNGDEDGGGDVTPPEQNPPTEQKYIEASLVGYTSAAIFDFTNNDFVSANVSLANGVGSYHGDTMLKWETQSLFNTAELQSDIDISNYDCIKFSVYSEYETDTVIQITVEPCKSSFNLTLDFAGIKHFEVPIEEFSVLNPYPKITALSLYSSHEYANTTVYLSSFTAAKRNYELLTPKDVNISDTSIYTDITSRYREYLVGSAEKNTHSQYIRRMNEIANECKTAWDSFKSTYTGQKNSLFELEINGSGDEAKITQLYLKILNMAKGYAATQSQYYKKPELLADIKTALEYGYTYYYGKNVIESGTFGGWWNWDIGVPQNLIAILVLLENDLDSGLIRKYLEPFDYLVPHPIGSAANKAWSTTCVTLAGALERDAMKIAVAKHYFLDVFAPVTTTENYPDGGFYIDGSFVQHQHTAYTGGYGRSLLSEITNLQMILHNTKFDLEDEDVQNQYVWINDAFRPLIFGKSFTSAVAGRECSRGGTEYTRLIDIMVSMIKMTYYTEGQTKSELESLIRTVMLTAKSNFCTKVPVPLIVYAYDLYQNDNVSLISDYTMAKVYRNMDITIQHTAKYGVCLALSSTRISKYESISNENKTGWYHGDGMIYVYTDGYDFGKEFFWWADPYLMPGTTVNLSPRKAVNLSQTLNASPFAGGVEQGKYAASGFILEYKCTNNSFKNPLGHTIFAKKSYFFFDDEIVCVGSNIYDLSGTEVRTVVENRLWREGDVLSVNGVSIAPATVETTVDARTMHFTNMGGYVFLGSGNTVIYQMAQNDGKDMQNHSSASGIKDFLEISLSHGIGTGELENDMYAYVYLPEATVQETENYDDVVMLRRGSNAHAVLEKTLGAIGCVFFGSDRVEVKGDNTAYTSIRKVEATTPCAVMISKDENGETVISAADPTQEYKKITFTVTLEELNSVVSSDANVQTSINGNTVTVTVDVTNARGASFTLTVK